MSQAQDLSNTRRALSRVSTDLKKGMFISAATSIRDAARLFTRGVPMIRNEHEEFVNMLRSACELLRFNKEVARLFPLAIAYAPGQEAALIEVMNQLIEALQEASTEEAIKKHEARKQAGLDKGRQELADELHDEARQTFREITEEYKDDATLATEVGESFLEAGLYEDATRYLDSAATLTADSTDSTDSTESAYVFNRLGIALRKMKRYEKAEDYFLRALKIDTANPNLHFNMGRLYLEMVNWKKTIECAEKALELNQDFTEAAKLAAYAKKMLAGG